MSQIVIQPATGLHHRHKAQEDKTQEVLREIKALSTYINPPVPNPAPLGLIGFGLTTALLQLKHTRIAGENSDELNGVDNLCFGFAMFFGGLLQIIASIVEIRRNNIFGFTAFGTYGGFWMAIATVEIVSLLATAGPPTINMLALQGTLFMFGVVTFMFWVLTFKMHFTISALFFLLGMTFMLLSFGTQNETVDVVGGYVGIITAAVAFWLAFAELVNDVLGEGKEIISLGHFQCLKSKSPDHVTIPEQARTDNGDNHVEVLQEVEEGSAA